MQVDFNVTQLMDALIYHWSFWEENEDFYLRELVPKLTENPGEGDEIESEIFELLRARLSNAELETIPELIRKRRSECLLQKIETKPIPSREERLRTAEAERCRVQAQERARQEELILEAEEFERRKQEKQHQENEGKGRAARAGRA